MFKYSQNILIEECTIEELYEVSFIIDKVSKISCSYRFLLYCGEQEFKKCHWYIFKFKGFVLLVESNKQYALHSLTDNFKEYFKTQALDP